MGPGFLFCICTNLWIHEKFCYMCLMCGDQVRVFGLSTRVQYMFVKYNHPTQLLNIDFFPSNLLYVCTLKPSSPYPLPPTTLDSQSLVSLSLSASM